MKLLILSAAAMCAMFSCTHNAPPPDFVPHTQCNETCNTDYDCVNSICGSHCTLNGARGYCGNLRLP